MSARTHVHGKMFRRQPREFPARRAKKSRVKERERERVKGERDAKNGARCSGDRKPRALRVFFLFFSFFLHAIGIRARGALIVASCIPKISCFFSARAC